MILVGIFFWALFTGHFWVAVLIGCHWMVESYREKPRRE